MQKKNKDDNHITMKQFEKEWNEVRKLLKNDRIDITKTHWLWKPEYKRGKYGEHK